MYCIDKISFVIFLVTTGISCYSQIVDPPYEVGIWHGFRQTAINYTFDDGSYNQFAKAIPMFNEFDFDLTLFTVTNWIPNWTTLKSAASDGHEVASHTVSHANFGNINSVQQTAELKDSKEIIENNVPGQQCITMAYPYCARGIDSICSKYYIAARGCQGFIEPGTPGTFMNVSSIACGSAGSVKTLKDFKTKFESAAISNGWCVFLLHGIDNDGGYSPLPSDILRSSIEFLSVRKSKFWVTTFKNTALYVKERNAVSVTETFNEDTTMTLQVTDNLVDSIYNYPLTLRRPLPLEWPSADVLQNNDTVPARIVMVDSIVYLMFDVIPDNGEVRISKNNNYVIPEIDTIPPDDDTIPATYLENQRVNSALNEENIKFSITENNLILIVPALSDLQLLLSLYDVRGTCLLSQRVNTGIEGRTSIILPEQFIRSGMYIVRLTDGKASWTKKVSVNF